MKKACSVLGKKGGKVRVLVGRVPKEVRGSHKAPKRESNKANAKGPKGGLVAGNPLPPRPGWLKRVVASTRVQPGGAHKVRGFTSSLIIIIIRSHLGSEL